MAIQSMVHMAIVQLIIQHHQLNYYKQAFIFVALQLEHHYTMALYYHLLIMVQLLIQHIHWVHTLKIMHTQLAMVI
jgi:hypothetical protein